MISRTLLAFGLVALDAVAAGPCKPVTTSSALSSDTTTGGSTTSAVSTETAAVTITESATETTTAATTLETTATSDLTTLLSVTSDFTSYTTEAATTEATTADTTVTSDLTTLLSVTSDFTTYTTEAATTTTTADAPDSTEFSIYPDEDVDASGPLQVRMPLGGEVYFNNPNANYGPGTFYVSGRGKLVNGAQLMCAFFRTGQQYGDIVGCQPNEPDARYSPVNCELSASGQLDCSVQGKFCYYSQDMLQCEDRGLYPWFYIENAGSYGYSLSIGPSGVSNNLTPVQLADHPAPTEP
ncbi:hypothetical protein FBEOM_12122 [Fusarium beomiforme]|uniref:Uncharacterized protein n=1 Tax=Fusarium beomiforme TaxID=44412 RepID=A0A9P5DSS3_9HYPO|nr:hypothetical protein FBEOM_12122 [Fusarium beomiforme]